MIIGNSESKHLGAQGPININPKEYRIHGVGDFVLPALGGPRPGLDRRVGHMECFVRQRIVHEDGGAK